MQDVLPILLRDKRSIGAKDSSGLFALRTVDLDQATALPGMAQSFGYLLAALGPPAFGVLRDATKSWTLPLALLLAVTACLLAAGLGAGRDARVGPPA
jgi:MFS transporter, CP family, cyanate transporter